MIEESQDLETHLNLITDFTGSLVRILLSTMSCGRWFFLCRRTTGGSLISDTFRHIDRHGKTGGSGSGRVNRVAGQKQVIFKRVSRVAGQTGHRLSRVASRVELTRIFQFFFYFLFFEVDAICQLFMSSLTIIRFSLVILLPITTKHLT